MRQNNAISMGRQRRSMRATREVCIREILREVNRVIDRFLSIAGTLAQKPALPLEAWPRVENYSWGPLSCPRRGSRQGRQMEPLIVSGTYAAGKGTTRLPYPPPAPSRTSPYSVRRTHPATAPAYSSRSGRTTRLAPPAACPRPAGTESRPPPPVPPTRRRDQTAAATGSTPPPADSCPTTSSAPSAPPAARWHCRTSRHRRKHTRTRGASLRPATTCALWAVWSHRDTSDRRRSHRPDRGAPRNCRTRSAPPSRHHP